MQFMKQKIVHLINISVYVCKAIITSYLCIKLINIIKKHKEGQLYVANNRPLHKIGVSFSSDSKYTIYTPNYASVSVKQF